MASTSGTINTNAQGSTAVTLAITTETLITLDVFNATGTHDNSKMTLEFSPDNGDNWLQGDQFTNGTGSISFHRATTKVRAYVHTAEGSTATSNVFITAV